MLRGWIARAAFVALIVPVALGITGLARGQYKAAEVLHPSLSFTDVANARGIVGYKNVRGHGSGVALADFDNDGDIDIFVVQAAGRTNQLYVNSGEGFFDEMAAAWGLADAAQARVALWFDIDNDQDLDLLVANDDERGTSSFKLYRRDPTRFTDVTVAAGVSKAPVAEIIPFIWAGIAAGDLNNDGYMDFVSGQWLGPTHVFFNDGDGTFTDVTNTCGMSPYSRWNHQPVMADFDGDGWLDVYMANDFEPNELWINQQNGTFVDMAAAAGVNNTMNDMGVTLGDYDNDGDLDIYITNIYSPENIDDEYNMLYRNDSVQDTLRFTDVTKALGVGNGAWGWGATFLDVDRDGNLDIAATNGWTSDAYPTDTSRFYWNPNGGATAFIEEAVSINFNDTFWGSALVAADFDRDGDLDLMQACLESAVTSPRLRLLDNEPNFPSDQNHWLVIQPRIDGPNHFAIGAIVRCQAAGRNMMRLITAGTSYMAQEPAEAFFGLGPGVLANVRVEWPDGHVTELKDVAVDQVVEVSIGSVTLLSSSATFDNANMQWRLDNLPDEPVWIERKGPDGLWTALGGATTDALGEVSYDDTTVLPGTNYSYRVAFDLGNARVERGEVQVAIPGPSVIVVSSSARVGRAIVQWRVDGSGSLSVAVQRSVAGGSWAEVSQAVTDANGNVEYEDVDVLPSTEYSYRIAFDIGMQLFELGETMVRIPDATFALRSVRPNPSPGEIIVSFDLPSSAPATLELLDLSGRKLRTVHVGAFGAGTHVLDLSHGMNLRPALYVVRLTRGGQSSSRKVAIIP